MRGVSARVYALDVDYYRPVAEAVLGPFAEGERRDFAWSRHEDWIRGLFQRDPIFSPNENETTPLAAVYHRLRCFWHAPCAGDPTAKPERAAHLGDLHGTVWDWLGDRGDGDIRVVAGGPGCGKSSFALAFATEVIAAGCHRVIYIQLQHFALGDNLHGRIGDYLTQRNTAVDPRGSAGFPENPLDWRAEDPTPVLILFDGLDELSPDDDKARDLSRKFLFTVRNMLTSLNSSGPTVRALVAGRSAACQDAMREADLDLRALLHVAPLTPLTGPASHQLGRVVRVEDPAGLGDRDERPDFWRLSSPGGDLPVPEAVQAEVMRELNAEPLLLRLLIVSGYVGEDWPAAADNRNLVYEAIFGKIFERNRRKLHIAAHGLERPDFFTLLECLGLAAWQGNGRTGSEADFARLRDLHATAAQRRKFQSLHAAELRSVAIQFYTMRDLDGSGFEFIHKSFGEYLTARGLLSFGLHNADWIEDPRHPPKLEDAARRWVEVTGKTELSEEVIRFLVDEGRRVPAVAARAALDTLTQLFDWTLRQGMPAHRVLPEAGYRDLETMQRSAETALLAVMDTLNRRARAEDVAGLSEAGTVAIHWPRTHMPQCDLLNRIRATVSHPSRMLLGCLDFSGADLSYMYLANACLRWANLRGTNLFRAELDHADLAGADLDRASLSAVNLDESDLSRCNLTGAKLVDGSLIGARLRDAILNGADLTGADLGRADLDGASLDGCRLGSARLGAAINLTQEQVDRAHGNAGTTLPAGFTRPAHWTIAPV